ncbi:quinoprotein relay system zinc metallohydrolase 1 [Novosphingobium sp. SG751A]|uniref:quinoprotein relay system zinc metallohydrolase 1 n=1 Tax=Novosphingobium sp. SG751A TaxID=2587000 RepID=UPI001555AD87|nr:quinoprotein relay system zinc metallohydrolase 1 [Novosphingobium sp. SG751A]NOW46750.1 quinoprotein relay system zinc metallohydrolase 1 [Novosphingobium sp. SG751A]
MGNGFTRRAMIGAMMAAPLAAHAAQRYTLKPDQVAPGVWVVRGADEAIAFANGGAIANCTILAAQGGAILCDCGPSLAYGQALAEWARKLTGGPVLRVLITHLHPDHAMGTAAFDPAIIAALPETRHELERDGRGFSDGMYRLLADWMTGTNVVLPGMDVTPGPFEIGGRALEAIALSGHSGGDLAIMDRASGTLIAGDLVFHNRAPATPDADLSAWRRSLDALDGRQFARLIPGHGSVDATHGAIAQTRDWLTWLEGALALAVARGLDMGEAGDMVIPERFAGVALARYELQRSVSHFYARLEASELPRIDN